MPDPINYLAGMQDPSQGNFLKAFQGGIQMGLQAPSELERQKQQEDINLSRVHQQVYGAQAQELQQQADMKAKAAEIIQDYHSDLNPTPEKFRQYQNALGVWDPRIGEMQQKQFLERPEKEQKAMGYGGFAISNAAQSGDIDSTIDLAKIQYEAVKGQGMPLAEKTFKNTVDILERAKDSGSKDWAPLVSSTMFGLAQLHPDSAKAVDAYQLNQAKERSLTSKADALASLPKEQQKIVTDAQNESDALGLAEKAALGMANSWEALRPEPGKMGEAGEAWKKIRGSEDLDSSIRKDFAAFKMQAQKEIAKGQGAISNYERQLFQSSAPTEFTNPDVVASFLRKYAATQNIKKEAKQAEVDWIQNNGRLGAKAKVDQEVGGFLVPAGSRLSDVTDSIYSNLPTIEEDIKKALKAKGRKDADIQAALADYNKAKPQPKLKQSMPVGDIGLDNTTVPTPAPVPKAQSDLPNGEGQVNPEALIPQSGTTPSGFVFKLKK